MELKKFTIKDIKSWGPCYPPEDKLPAGWEGTALDILKLENISHDDKLWCVCREGIISDKTLRLFAVWCARQVEHLMKDDRSRKALAVAKNYANRKATKEELAAARDAARAAERAAAWDARDARDAAGTAARAKQIKHLIKMLNCN